MKTFSFFLLIAFISLCAVNTYAQKYGIYKKTLDNGLDVIVINNPAVPLVTVEIDVKNGAYTESSEYDGLSHLYGTCSSRLIQKFQARKRTWKGCVSLGQHLTELQVMKE